MVERIDQIAHAKLSTRPEIQRDFSPITIAGKGCFYNDQFDDRVIFIKIKKGKVRLGILFGFHKGNDRFTQVNVPLNFAPKETYLALGIETGFIFIERKYEDFGNWEAEYQKLLELYGEERLNGLIQKMKLLTIHEYVSLINSCTASSLKRY